MPENAIDLTQYNPWEDEPVPGNEPLDLSEYDPWADTPIGESESWFAPYPVDKAVNLNQYDPWQDTAIEDRYTTYNNLLGKDGYIAQAADRGEISIGEEGDDRPGHFWQGLESFISQVPSIATDVIPMTVYRAYRRGKDVTLEDETGIDRLIRKNIQERAKYKKLSEEERQKKWFRAKIPFTNIGIDINLAQAEDVADSLGYSVVNAFSTLLGRAVGRGVGATMGPAAPVTTPALGVAAGFASGYYVASGATRDEFVERARDAYLKEVGGKINAETEAGWQARYEMIKSDADWTGFWEAAPETVGNLLMFGIAKLPIKGAVAKIGLAGAVNKLKNEAVRKIGKELINKVGIPAAKLMSMLTEETLTEALTSMKQSEIEYRNGMRDKPLSYLESIVEVLPTVLLTTPILGLGMGGAAKILEKTTGKIVEEKDKKKLTGIVDEMVAKLPREEVAVIREQALKADPDHPIIDLIDKAVKTIPPPLPSAKKVSPAKEVSPEAEVLEKGMLARKESVIKTLEVVDQEAVRALGREHGLTDTEMDDRSIDQVISMVADRVVGVTAPVVKGQGGGIEALETAISGIDKTFKSGTVKEAPTNATRAQTQNIASAMGAQVTFFEETGKSMLSTVNGFYDAASNRIFISAEATNPALRVLGHEAWHKLREEHSDLYKNVLAVAKGNKELFTKFVGDINKRRVDIGQKALEISDLTEEYFADFAGDMFAKASFWKAINKSNPSFAKKIAASLRKIIQDFRHLIAAKPELKKIKQPFENMDQVEAAMAEAFGKALPKEAKLDIKVPEFKEWFKGSKVVDEKGEPLMVYHGFDKAFTKFQTPSYFAESQEEAKSYGKKLFSGYLNIKKPYNVDHLDMSYLLSPGKKWIDSIQKKGYDGLVGHNLSAVTDVEETYWVAFEPNQIRSIEVVPAEAKKGIKLDIKTPEFKTGQQVTFQYLRNLEKAPDMGARFGQDIEPAGSYVIHNETGDTYLKDKFPDKYEIGEITFKNPLVIKIKEPLDHKKILYEKYKKKGEALSRAIAKDGYDGIVSMYPNGSTGEIVDISKYAKKALPAKKPAKTAAKELTGVETEHLRKVNVAVNRVMKLAKNAMPTDVVNDISNLADLKINYSEILDWAKRTRVLGVDVPVAAFWDRKNDRVVLIANQFTSVKEAMSAWLHEQIGHKGMEDLFANMQIEFNEFLDAVYSKAAGNTKQWLDLAVLYSTQTRSMSVEEGRRYITREFLAQKAEQLSPGKLKQVYQLFRDFINKWFNKALGTKEKIVELKDIPIILETAKRFVYEGHIQEFKETEFKDSDEIMSFIEDRFHDKVDKEPKLEIQAYHGTGTVFEEFDTGFIGTGEGSQAFGYGLYFTSIGAIAEYYARSISKKGIGQSSLVGIMPFSPNKGLPNSAWIAAKELSEALVTDTGVTETFSKLDVISQRRVFTVVRALIQDNKILDSVVRSIPVNVVDMLGGKQVPAKELRHDPSMLIDLLPINADDLISSGIKAMDILTPVAALSAAKVHTGLSRFNVASGDFLTAKGTIDHNNLQSIYGKIPHPKEFVKGKRQFYKVTLHKGKKPGDYKWLDWYEKLSENQWDKIAKNADSKLIRDIIIFRNLTEELDTITELPDKIYKERPELTKKFDELQAKRAKIREGLMNLDLAPYWKDLVGGHLQKLSYDRNLTGNQLYNLLSDIIGSKKEASLFLLRAGIDGIRYPTETLSGKLGKGFNYVVFDADAISIEDRVSFSLKGPELSPIGKQYMDTFLGKQGEDAPVARSRIRGLLYPWKYVTGKSLASGETVGEILIRKMQDKYIHLKKLQNRLSPHTDLEDKIDVYLAEEQFSGRTGWQLDQFEANYVKPFVDKMIGLGIDAKDLDLYVYAAHAPERNARIDEKNPDFREKGIPGSGMHTEVANTIIKRYREKGMLKSLEGLAKILYKINGARIKLLLNAGLITQDQHDAILGTYKRYVPLRGKEGEPDFMGSGRGFSTPSTGLQRALGRKSFAQSPLAWSLGAVEETIVKINKNEVGKSLLGLIREFPDKDLWTIDEITTKQKWDPEKGEVETVRVPAWAQTDILHVWEDGKRRNVKIKDPLLEKALLNIGAEKMNAVIAGLARFNRYLAMVNTSLNPEFVFTNFVRDIQTAGINLSADQSAKLMRKVMKDVPKALRHAYRGYRGKPGIGDWGKWFKLYRSSGGSIGFFGLRGIDDKIKTIDAMVKRTRKGVLPAARRGMSEITGYISDVNSAVENAVRLSAFKNAVESGMTPARAASLSKNLTVNFNRKGELGAWMNSFYLFYNAGIQGTARVFQVMTSKTGRRIGAGIAATAFMMTELNRMAGGDDEEDGRNYYDKIPNYVKERSIILMIPGTEGKYIRFPLPYGYNVFWAVGEQTNSALHSGKPVRGAINILNTAVDAFNPMGGDSSLIRTLSPTLPDVLLDLYMNQNFAGYPIKPEQPQFGLPKPQSWLYWRSVSPISKYIAQKVNKLTGGNPIRSGKIDVSPEVLDYLTGTFTGAAGAFINRSLNLGIDLLTGKEVPIHKTPFQRVFMGEQTEFYIGGEYRKATEEIKRRIEEKEEGLPTIAPELSSELRSRYEATEKNLRSARKRIKDIERSQLSAKRKKELVEKKRKEMTFRQKDLIKQFDTEIGGSPWELIDVLNLRTARKKVNG